MMMKADLKTWLLAGFFLLLMSTGCQGSQPNHDLGITAPPGYQVDLFASDLEGPTQIIYGPDERLWLAQLAGSESGGTGQILALDPSNPAQREILVTGLFKPTGIAVIEDSLWIAAGRQLLRANLDEDSKPGMPETVLTDLPFNGRSNGTLTVTASGSLLYETSGSRRGNQAVEGSASIWSLDPANPGKPRLLASGMKNAYAHSYDGAGRLWATDIADDPVNGEPPPDELNLIEAGADYGWPACFGDQKPASNYGGTEAACARTQPAVATFPPRSTPTSVIPSPWEENVLLVALWGPTDPAVVRVHWIEVDGRPTADEISPFLTGLGHPQSLLLLGDGSLLVSDFNNGRVYRVYQR